MEQYQLTRRQAREAGIIYFYQYLVERDYALHNKSFFNLARFIDENMNSLNIYLQEKFKTKKQIKLVNDELFILLVSKMNDIDKISNDLSSHLDKSWTFERLSLVDQAILITSYIQVKDGSVDKNIVINEAVELAKEYSDDESYKYINGVLDSL